MATKTQPNTLGDVLKYEAPNFYSREDVTVLSGQNLKAGTVLGRVAIATPGSSAAFAGNTGDGAMGAIAVGAGAKAGDYTLVVIEPATDAGAFVVTDPDGVVVGTGTVAVEFAQGGLTFTLADGGTDFAAGDGFTITVPAGTLKVKASPDPAQADGSEGVVGILALDVDASAADVAGVMIKRQAVVSIHGLVYDASVDDDAKKTAKIAQIEALGIAVRSAA